IKRASPRSQKTKALTFNSLSTSVMKRPENKTQETPEFYQEILSGVHYERCLRASYSLFVNEGNIVQIFLDKAQPAYYLLFPLAY
ncbi:MAG: hypothetical protein ACYDAA_16905, partial [Syntrophales bacterium]